MVASQIAPENGGREYWNQVDWTVVCHTESTNSDIRWYHKVYPPEVAALGEEQPGEFSDTFCVFPEFDILESVSLGSLLYNKEEINLEILAGK